MRPEGYGHAGFYPLTEGAAILAAKQFKIEGDPTKVSVLDPCIGDGVAIKRIMDALKIPTANLRAVELTSNRGAEAKALMPDCTVLTPCDFLGGCNRPDRGFTFTYANPPFSPTYGGGGRTETQFLEKIGHMMPVGGALCMVVPYSTLNNSGFRGELSRSWRRVRIVKPKYEDAPYNETIVCAIRSNNKPAFGNYFSLQYEDGDESLREASRFGAAAPGEKPKWLVDNPEEVGSPFLIPDARRMCDSFHKTALTDEEIGMALLASPIERNIGTPPPIDRGRPPLALTTGHNGMLVASGQAPPIVTKRDKLGRMLEVPHLVRGVARKVNYIKSEETEEKEDGSERTKTVISEAVDLKVMVLLYTGQIVDLNQDREAVLADGDNVPEAEKRRMLQMLHSDSGSGNGGIGI